MIWLLLGVFFCSCGNNVQENYKLSEVEFEHLLFDVGLAREASKTADFNIQDSLFRHYLEAVALRYNLEAAEAEKEIRLRLASIPEFESVFDNVRERIDSLKAEKKLN